MELQGSLGAQGGGIRSEYELHPNWTVETDIGSSMRSTIGINWRKDY